MSRRWDGSPLPEVKRCPVCGETRPSAAFNRNGARHDGLDSICKVCRRQKDVDYRISRPEYRENKRRATRRWTANTRDLAFRLVGGDDPTCTCCGESEPVFLVIDHRDGGGHQHRKSLGRNSTYFYRWLVLHPEAINEYQVLCANCNMAKERINLGGCPVAHAGRIKALTAQR